MEGNFETCLNLVLKHEGGFVNHSQDPGGMTNLGVTARTWEDWVGHKPSEKEMRELTGAKVAPLYKRKFWDACKCDDLHAGVDYVVFDLAVNSGPGRAAKFLQEAVGATPDGRIGPRTLSAAADFGANLIIHKICDRRESFYRALPTFPTFGKGWLRRNEEVQKKALEMAAQAVR